MIQGVAWIRVHNVITVSEFFGFVSSLNRVCDISGIIKAWSQEKYCPI